MDPKNITHIIDGVPVGTIFNRNDKPYAVSLFCEGVRLYAELKGNKVILFDNFKTKIASYDRNKDVLTWALDESCKDREVVDELWTRKLLIAHGVRYSKDLVEVVRTGVLDYLDRSDKAYK